MRIDRVELRKIRMPMKEPFETSFGVEVEKSFLLLSLHAGDYVGYGECGAAEDPFYLEETNVSAAYILSGFLIPVLLRTDFASPSEFSMLVSHIRRNEMAIATVEAALWDLFAKIENEPLYRYIGGVKHEIEVGISVGIQPSVDRLVEKVSGYLESGYRRIKVKIKPGKDLVQIQELRRTLGDFPLMADANSSYTLDDIETLAELDRYNLMMIEQPLAYDDLVEHAELAGRLETPICLDESIRSLDHLRAAVILGSCSIVNLKMPRVGGVHESLRVAEYCTNEGIGLWCGGLLEAGVGRAFNLAITSLDAFTLPGDTAPSARYFERDIVKEPAVFSSPGVISLSEAPGIGTQIDDEVVAFYTETYAEFEG